MNIFCKCGKSSLLFWLISITYSIGLFAQVDFNNKIKAISFQGNKKNRVHYLKQFIQSKAGELPIDSLILSDIQHLKNIASIGNATYHIDTTDHNLKLIFQIEEVNTLLPIINFGGTKGNIWYQLGFSDINWQGNGSFISAVYQNYDRRHGGQIYYRTTRLKESDWGFSLGLNKWASSEPLFFEEGIVNYDYDNTSVGLTVIKEFGLHQQLEIGGTYFVEKYAKSAYQILENTPGPSELEQAKYLSKVIYKGNYLNYHFFYLKGFCWTATLQNVYSTLDKTWFYSMQVQGKYFSRLGKKSNLATRFQLGIATNNDSPFAPFVVDSQVNLRGIGNRIDRGTAQIIFNAEYRHTNKEFKKWAVQTVAFLDIGTWRNPGAPLEDLFNNTHFRQFVGGGLRVINKKIYGAVLRIDYGIDILNTNQHGLVVGVGQYF